MATFLVLRYTLSEQSRKFMDHGHCQPTSDICWCRGETSQDGLLF